MKLFAVVFALLVLLGGVLPARSEGGKAEVLRRIEALLEEGNLDEAKRMIDFFLDKNPGDPDLARLEDRWRVQKGDLSGLFEGADDEKFLREVCWRIVAATMAGNPEEWSALLDAGDADRVKELLGKAKESGTPEDRRVAGDLLETLAGTTGGPADVPAERVLAAIRSGSPADELWGLGEAERRKLGEARVDARRLYQKSDRIEVRYAAAGVLLALDDRGAAKIRDTLRAGLRADRPVDAMDAGRVLLRHPGPGKQPVTDLLAGIEEDEKIGRAKPELLALGVAALAERQEPGAREFLEARLDRADLRVDAARALGVLGDEKAVPALVDYVTSPPPGEEEATSGGLGFLGGHSGGAQSAATAEALRPALVGALAILRLTK